MDLTRLMYEDGATRPAEPEDSGLVNDYPVVIFEFQGALWEGRRWLKEDPWPGYGWNFSEFYPVEQFLNDPVAYGLTHWHPPHPAHPGWYQITPPNDQVENPFVYAMYCFKKL